jgi:quinohemoprotein ethanol dehydrogenase
VLAFKLDGKAQLPVFEPQSRAIVAAKVDVSEQQLAEGFTLFGRHCAACHGIELLSAGVLPDLRTSPALADPEVWRGIILGGALEARGMVSFSDRLDAREAEILRGYVASEASGLATISP